jgi:hypothetical protein
LIVAQLQEEVDKIDLVKQRSEDKKKFRIEERKKRLEKMSPKSDSDDSIDIEEENRRDEMEKHI